MEPQVDGERVSLVSRERLLYLEWSDASEEYGYEDDVACPVCGGRKPGTELPECQSGHAYDCWLAALLRSERRPTGAA